MHFLSLLFSSNFYVFVYIFCLSIYYDYFIINLLNVKKKEKVVLYLEAHVFILETWENLGICYRIMLVLLLFMYLLLVD